MNDLALTLAYKYGAHKAAIDTGLMPQFLLDAARSARFDMPDLGVFETQAGFYQRLSWLYTATKMRGTAAALQPLNVKQLAGEDTSDIDNHPFELLLRRPNPLMSRFEFLRDTISWGCVNGNAYWWLNRASETAEPREMWLLPPWRVLPIPDEKMYLAGYAYDPGHGLEPYTIPTWQIVHFKEFNPTNEFIGLSPIEPIGRVALTDIASVEWSYKYYAKNNARLPGILAFKDAVNNPLAWERIKADIREAAETRNLLLLRGVGDKVEWLKAAATQDEMQQIAARELTKEEIYSLICPGAASVLAINSTEANSKAGKQTMYEFAVWPDLVLMHEKITNDILPVYGDNLIAEFEDPRQVDRALELQEQEMFGRSHTINEIRAQYYEDDEIEDERGLLLPAQVGAAPIPMYVATGEEPPPMPQFQPAGQEPEEPDETEPETQPEEDEEAPAEIKADLDRWRRKAIKALKSSGNAACTFESEAIDPDLHARLWARLSACKSASDVRAVFSEAIAPEPPPGIEAINDQIKALTRLVEANAWSTYP